MIKTLLKIVVFSAAVLLLGQVRVGDATLAGQFHGFVTGSLRKGGDLIKSNPLLAKVTRGIGAGGGDKSARPAEALSDADRESLRRLLQ